MKTNPIGYSIRCAIESESSTHRPLLVLACSHASGLLKQFSEAERTAGGLLATIEQVP